MDASPLEKKKKSRAPIRWRALIRKTVAILSILGYENVFGRDIEDMNASVASAAWIALLKTLPRLATCSLPSLPTVDEMLRLFKHRKSPLYFIGTYVLGTDEATAGHVFVERQKGRKYALCDEKLLRARLAKLYDVANVVPPRRGHAVLPRGGRHARRQEQRRLLEGSRRGGLAAAVEAPSRGWGSGRRSFLEAVAVHAPLCVRRVQQRLK